MSETPPKVRDLAQELEDSLVRAKEARDAKIVRGDEHPSGLRDAISESIDEHGFNVGTVEDAVSAWLSHIGEGEIDAAARAIHDEEVGFWPVEQVGRWNDLLAWYRDAYRRKARAALAASRGVLVSEAEEPG